MKQRIDKLFFLLFLIALTNIVNAQKTGDLDSTFGKNGVLTLDSLNSIAYSVAIQPDGKILVAGSTGGSQKENGFYLIIRLNSEGTLDTSFANGGILKDRLDSSGTNFIHDIIIQKDGKIIAVGYVYPKNENYFKLLILRFNKDGSKDKLFGNGGAVVEKFSEFCDGGSSVDIQSDGKIVVSGVTNFISEMSSPLCLRAFCLARYNANGTLDKKFGNGGKVVTTFQDGADFGTQVALLPDGKIILAGNVGDSLANSGDNFTLLRYNSNGAIDKSFGIKGKVTTVISETHFDLVFSLAIQPDGKIIVSGTTGFGKKGDFVLVRYNTNGSLDNDFGTKGKTITKIGNGQDIAFSLAIQPDGKIITAGFSAFQNIECFSAARYTKKGFLDESFSPDGRINTPINEGMNSRIMSITIQPDGKIVAVGVYTNTSNTYIAIARYIGL